MTGVMAEGIKSLSELAPFPDEVSKDNEVHNRKGASALYHIIDRNWPFKLESHPWLNSR